MPSIRITRFAGLLPQMNPKALALDHAQVAHNCLLWDGWLHPMPKWQFVENIPNSAGCIYFNPTATNEYKNDYYLVNAIQNLGEPFISNQPIGINRVGFFAGQLSGYNDSGSNIYPLGIPAPTVTFQVQNITPMGKSVYPISRTYAITYLFGKQEGPPFIFNKIGASGTLFEGDIVTLNITLDPVDIINSGITGMVFYRTIPGFDTSEQLGNPLETGFHRVGTVALPGQGIPPPGNIVFVDDKDSSEIQGDLLISDQWIPPVSDTGNFKSLFFGQTEGGWAVNARYDGVGNQAPNAVQFSERFMHFAWPMQNTVGIPQLITGMAIFYDNVFIGTQSVAYHISLQSGEQEALDIHVRPFINQFACTPFTMVATNFGAMYASKDGLIALTADRDTVSSKSVASPGDVIPTVSANLHFYDATYAAWWNGNYFGFCTRGIYVFNQPSPANNEFPLGQLVTIDQATNTSITNAVATGKGFFALYNGQNVYKLPLPGYGYESATLATYTWLSKRFVMRGLTSFAAAKVVNDNSGSLTFTINGYNRGGETNPSFTYSRPLAHSKPFRIPHQNECIEWEVLLTGTSVVQEVHVATSVGELTEIENNG